MVGWGILSFAILQVYEPVMHGLHLPEWTLTLVVVVLGLGFPATFVLAWIFDVGPGGVERTPSTSANPSTPARRLRTALLLIGLGSLFSVPGWAWYLFRERTRVIAPGVGSPEPGAGVGSAPAEEAAGASIAVLPFADMSERHDQEYFADGMAEEILNALAQVDGLHVCGRTSSFSFKGRNEDLRGIGHKLGVATVLEGSVRRAGDQVRITAQLVRTADGFHLWSRTFDRDLANVLALQEEIAQAVVAALRLKLLPGAASPTRPVDLRAHDAYLLGTAQMSRGTGEAFREAVKNFQKAVEIDPGYALAWAALSTALFWHGDQAAQSGEQAKEFPAAVVAADRAVALAPDLAQGYRARALVRDSIQLDLPGAQADIERARALSPQSPEVLAMQATLLAQAGRLSEAIAVNQQAASLDPLSPEIPVNLSAVYLGTGQLELAEASARRALEIAPNHGRAARNLGFALLLQGRLAEARAAFHRSSNTFFSAVGDAMVDHALGDAVAARRSLEVVLAGPTVVAGAYQVAQIHAWRGEIDEAFEWLGVAAEHHDAGLMYFLFDPFLKPLRGDPRHAALLDRLKLPKG